ncbi:MAG: DUF2336 domain-containing protein [Afipia sp.]
MAAAFSLIPELDDIVKNGSPEARAAAIERISALFLQGAGQFGTGHVAIFDDVLTGLVPASEVEARVTLAEQLADLRNAPPGLMRHLAREEEIRVAGPVLSRSPQIDDATLIDVSRMRGQPHLAALATRAVLPSTVTDVIVRRGERDVVRIVARNSGARFSSSGYSGLIKRAADDGMLAQTIGQRSDISSVQLRELLATSVDMVRRRLFEGARPERKAAINKAMLEISGAPKMQLVRRDFASAQREVLTLQRAGGLNEAVLLKFAREHQYEMAVAALSIMSGVRLESVDQLVLGDRYDPILILGKSAGLEWATVRTLIALRLGPGKAPSAPDVEEARVNFDRLSPTTAARVLAFWRARDAAKSA